MRATIEFFDDTASAYDVFQSSCVPKYPEMIRVAVDWLRRFVPPGQDVRILEIGTGTGNTTRELLRALPRCKVTCVDGSNKMLAIAREKLRGLDVTFHHADFAREDWRAPLAGVSFHGAISVLVLEHLAFDRYRTLLTEVLELMHPGAWTVAVEGYAGDRLQEIYFDEMSMLEKKVLREGVLSKELLERIKSLSAEKETHYFATPKEKRSWWETAGFAEVDLVWLYYCVGVMVGKKPGTAAVE